VTVSQQKLWKVLYMSLLWLQTRCVIQCSIWCLWDGKYICSWSVVIEQFEWVLVISGCCFCYCILSHVQSYSVYTPLVSKSILMIPPGWVLSPLTVLIYCVMPVQSVVAWYVCVYVYYSNRFMDCITVGKLSLKLFQPPCSLIISFLAKCCDKIAKGSHIKRGHLNTGTSSV